MLLAIIGVGIIQHGSIANAVTVGQQLTSPESGWQRYNYTFAGFKYNGNWVNVPNSHMYTYYPGSITFYAYTTRIRLLDQYFTNRTTNTTITIDDNTPEICSSHGSDTAGDYVFYEKTGLEKKLHKIVINNPGKSQNYAFVLEDVDIDKDGYIPVEEDESISIDKSSIDMTEGDSQSLTATTTPAGAQVTWSSSDSSIATVDSNGNVTAKSEGTCTITATINDGSGISASCTVDVTKKDTEPSDPTEPTGDANLYIELVDGQIKQYSGSSDEINNFTDWYENRDKDHSLKAIYKFTKGTYTDYVVHDQIDWFEVR